MSNIVFTPPSEYDLIDIELYIGKRLQNPNAAIRIVDGIIALAEDLAFFPRKHHYVNDPFLARIQIRMTYFENYNIFYVYDEPKDTAYILRVLYNRADWQNLLK